MSVRPSAEDRQPSRRISTRTFTLAALGLALLMACVVSAFASSSPDGLEFVAESTGFLDTARDSAASGSPLADYSFAGIDAPWLSVAVAGAVGCAITFGCAVLIGFAVRRRPRGARPGA